MSAPVIHHTAEVQSLNIGSCTSVWQYCVVLAGARIGQNCNINCHVFIENDVVIGDNVTVKSGVQLWDGMRIEDDVFIGPNVTFTNDMHPRSKHYPESYLQIAVQKGASIGANSTILGGLTIGPYALVGAGSVVTKDIPAYTLWYGNPAIFHGYVCWCGQKLNAGLKCESCGAAYKLEKGEVIPR